MVDESVFEAVEVVLAQVRGAVVAQEVARDAVVVEVVLLAQVTVLSNACRTKHTAAHQLGTTVDKIPNQGDRQRRALAA